MINVTVSTQTKPKSPYYQAVARYIDPITKKEKQEWKSTKVKYVDASQKRLHKQAEQDANIKAEEFRKQVDDRLNKTSASNTIEDRQQILFTDYLEDWLETISKTKETTTTGGYQSNIKSIIIPYFKEKELKLCEVTNADLQDFYDAQYRLGKSPKTVRNYHYNIRPALEKAKKLKVIPINPADECIIEKPKQYIPQVYNQSELKVFLDKIKGIDIEVPTMITAWYGFRREETMGLKWDRIDFDNDTITIAHTVSVTTINHKRVIVKKDIPKNKSSYRTLPLIPEIKKFLLKVKRHQDQQKMLFGNSYKNDENYICVDDEGKLISPDIVSKHFKSFLEDNKLRIIRFHDLRHSIGSLLIKKSSTREVQIWLRTRKCTVLLRYILI